MENENSFFHSLQKFGFYFIFNIRPYFSAFSVFGLFGFDYLWLWPFKFCPSLPSPNRNSLFKYTHIYTENSFRPQDALSNMNLLSDILFSHVASDLIRSTGEKKKPFKWLSQGILRHEINLIMYRLTKKVQNFL